MNAFSLMGAFKNLLSGERLWISEAESRLISLFKKKNVILSYFAVFGRFSDLKDIGEIGL